MRTHAWVGLWVVLSMLGCGSSGGASDAGATGDTGGGGDPLAGRWGITITDASLRPPNYTTQAQVYAFVSGAPGTLSITDTHTLGSGASTCPGGNEVITLSGYSYTTSASSLTIGNMDTVSVTRTGCMDPTENVTDMRSAGSGTYAGTYTFAISGNMLTITAASGAAVTLTRQ